MQQANGTILSINFGGTFVRLGVFENGEKVFSDELGLVPSTSWIVPMEVMRRLQGVGLNHIDFYQVSVLLVFGIITVSFNKVFGFTSLILLSNLGEHLLVLFEVFSLFLKTDVELEVIGGSHCWAEGETYNHLSL